MRSNASSNPNISAPEKRDDTETPAKPKRGRPKGSRAIHCASYIQKKCCVSEVRELRDYERKRCESYELTQFLSRAIFSRRNTDYIITMEAVGGKANTLERATEIAAKRGRVCMVGGHGAPLTFSERFARSRELTIIWSFCYGRRGGGVKVTN